MSMHNQPLDNGGRRIYNIGGHNSSLLDNFDVTASGGARRYDQAFDSQISQSMEHSYEFSSRQYDSQFGKTGGVMQRAETDIIKLQQVQQYSTQKKDSILNMRTQGQRLERIDELNTSSQFQRSNSKIGTRMGNTHAQPNQTSYDNNNILINSTKLEESVQAPNRLPIRIDGLTVFLRDEFYRFTGVYSVKKDTLFQFWKDHVSLVYRMCQADNMMKSKLDHTLKVGVTIPNMHDKSMISGLHNSLQKGMSTNKFDKENEKTKNAHNLKKKVKPEYEVYMKLYEIDVIYTLQMDLDEEENKFKSQQMQREQEAKKRYDAANRTRELEIIKWMIEEYYADLKNFELLKIEDQYEKDKVEGDRSPSKNWHKGKTGKDSLLESQASDHDKKEPKKPFIKEEIEKKVEKIDKEIANEQSFMLNLFIMVRDERLTNDPKEIFALYKDQKEKARLGVIWSKGDDDVWRLIREFFKAERFLKRLTLYYAYRNRLGQVKHLSLFGFYLQLRKRERQLYLIDWKLIKRKKEIKKDESLEKSKKTESPKKIQEKEQQDQSFEKQLTYEQNKEYSVEEIIFEYESWLGHTERYRKEKEFTEQEKIDKELKEKLLIQVYGKKKKEEVDKKLLERKGDKLIKQIAKPKDKWKRGKILLELKKKFPHDNVLQNMIKEEFKSNRVFKYPEEYDLYDDDEDILCKVPPSDQKGLITKDLGAGKTLRDRFKVLDDQELYYLKKKISESRVHEKKFEEFIVDKALKYLEMMKYRLKLENMKTIRQFLSEVYQECLKLFKDIMDTRFLHLTYGTKKNSETYKKSYPLSFKKYFFSVVKSYVKVGKGHRRLKNVAPTFIIPSGRKCTMHAFDCPEGCKFITLNNRVLLKATIMRKHHRIPQTYRSRVWRRRDFKKKLQEVYMLQSETDNCTFEPEAGSLSKTNHLTLKVLPNLARDGQLTNEPDPEAYFKKLGKNFEKSYPEVYKAGVLKKAKLLHSQGKYEEAMNKMHEGFNIMSIKKRFDPNFMKRFMAEEMLKKKNDRQKKEKEEELKKASGPKRIALQRDQPDEVKKKPEEDWENKKLIPILREAYDLVDTIESKRREAEKQIRRIEGTRRKLKTQVRGFSTYKKSQTRLDISKGEKVLFKSIMCPLKDKCQKDQRPKWPISNIKSITQFGKECPFAHHPMELRFPESLVTKLSSTTQTIKALHQKMDEEKPKQIFRPSGRLFDCVGCNSKSGKHMGGPCNLCRYKEMADESSKKFIDKKRKTSLMRSMERRESVEFKKEKTELKQIQEALDLDNNYTKKFGLLKKACILHFYGRYNDAFDQIAKAAEIVQKQKEIEQQKQKVVDKRWRFKLGLDDAFELPIPIEQIDPAKVDEKFMKKMDLQGQIQLATLKLFIEHTSPQKTEEFSKHAFLNKLIEDYYLQFEGAIEDKMQTIQKMKKQVEKLDEEADFMEAMGTTGVGSPSPSPEKGEGNHTMRVKARKSKMCPTLLEKKKCPLSKDKKCPFAHNPIELDLIGPETKMKNLNGVIMSQSLKIKNLKPIEAWKPAKSGDIEHTHLMDMTSKKRKRGNDEDEDEDHDKKKEKLKKSIFERENLFKKPYETNE